MSRGHSRVGAIVGLLIIVVVPLSCLMVLMRGLPLGMPASGPIDRSAWGELGEGMTKAQVRSLLGKPVDQVLYVPTPGERNIRWTRNYTNHYQYVIAGGAARGAPWCWSPHPKAYVVNFDENDTVVSWTTPAERPLPPQ